LRERVITVVAGLIRDSEGRLLTVRKTGSRIFMLPGGKPEPGEADADALARELGEELSVRIETLQAFGRFEAPAANEPGATVRSHVFSVTISGRPQAQAEIAETLWLDLATRPPVPLAPLLETQVLPRLRALD